MEEHVRKVLLVGNGSVGKSSLISRFVDDGFSRTYKQTVGLDFFERTVNLRDDLRVRMVVWDVGGQSIGSSMLAKYVYGSSIVVLCYDTTDSRSFADLEDWLALVRKHLPTQSEAPKLFLLGNKVDLCQLRQVSNEQHASFVRREALQGGYHVSARNGDSVLRAFFQMAAKSCGAVLSDFELALLTDRVIKVHLGKGDGHGESGVEEKSSEVLRIEEEDRMAEAQRRREMRRLSDRRRSCSIQ